MSVIHRQVIDHDHGLKCKRCGCRYEAEHVETYSHRFDNRFDPKSDAPPTPNASHVQLKCVDCGESECYPSIEYAVSVEKTS
jgi:DNA-directed RNA polymerase subunit M/transcription elongation factor TFIIS